jgi:hypothetical protein
MMKPDTLLAAAEGILEWVSPYMPEDYPKPAHAGQCTPESGCDCTCQEIYYMASRDAAIRRLRSEVAQFKASQRTSGSPHPSHESKSA